MITKKVRGTDECERSIVMKVKERKGRKGREDSSWSTGKNSGVGLGIRSENLKESVRTKHNGGQTLGREKGTRSLNRKT